MNPEYVSLFPFNLEKSRTIEDRLLSAITKVMKPGPNEYRQYNFKGVWFLEVQSRWCFIDTSIRDGGWRMVDIVQAMDCAQPVWSEHRM